MKLFLAITIIAISQACAQTTPIPDAKPQPIAISVERAESARLQIYLDNQNIGPGVIDGKIGTFTKMAVEVYNRKKGIPDSDLETIKQHAKDEITNIYATAIVPEIATAWVDPKFPVNNNRDEQAKRKKLHYRSIAEFMAERYHTSIDFLKLINGAKKVNEATPRTALLVPNVEPFRIELLKDGKSYKKDELLSTRWAVVDTKNSQLRIYEAIPGMSIPEDAPGIAQIVEEDLGDIAASPPEQIEEDKPVKIRIPQAEDGATSTPKALIVEEDPDPKQRLTPWDEHRATIVAAFPITPGQKKFIRYGKWKLMNSVELPTWRYDSSLLKTGVRSNVSLQIPAGPNNPVGIIWMGLSRRGIGMHGTDSPDTIGRARSAGCIRLSNWDAIQVPNYIRPGAVVFIK